MMILFAPAVDDDGEDMILKCPQHLPVAEYNDVTSLQQCGSARHGHCNTLVSVYTD